MVTAFVLIHANDKDFSEMGRAMLDIEGVVEAHVVAGEYDMVAVVRVSDTPTLSRILTEKLVHVPGVSRTKTLISLEAFGAE